METLFKTIQILYVLITFFSFIVLISSIKKFKNTAKTIILLLSIASAWVILNNVFWLFYKDTFTAMFPIMQRIPLLTEYSDYLVTTPLSLVALALFAMSTQKKNSMLLAILVLSDVAMLFTGAMAEYSTSFLRTVWFWSGFLPFVFILYLLWKPFRLQAKTQSALAYKYYLQLSTFITFFWSLYPLLWYVGPMGLGLISLPQLEIYYHYINIITKAGYYVFFYYKLLQLEKSPWEAAYGKSTN